jgi:hypothetical protein
LRPPTLTPRSMQMMTGIGKPTTETRRKSGKAIRR